MKKIFSICVSLITVAISAQDSTFQHMLDFSRPGNNHALLGNLSGKWAFQDEKLAFVKGTLIRMPIYNGRFYTVQITGGKLQVPVADGKMKEENYQEMQIEGYDNGQMKFVTTSINNHIGSDIELQMGIYDSTAKTFTYDWSSELIKGKKTQNRRILKITDNNHYSEEYYEIQNGALVKVRELDYTRAKQD
jgi:hypothetical protein